MKTLQSVLYYSFSSGYWFSRYFAVPRSDRMREL